MKLVLATPLYPPEIGGPSTYAKLLEEGLSEKGIEIELVKFATVRHLPKVLRHVAYFSRVYRALKSADLVLALDPVSVGLPACFAAFLARKPFVVKIVGDYAWEQGQQRFGVAASLDEFVKMRRVPFAVWLLRLVQRGVASHAARIIVPSNYLKGIVMTWGISSDTIEVIYNAVPLQKPGTMPEAVAAQPHPLVVTAGRLVPWKHIDGIIDAVSGLPEVSLAIVGGGPLRAALARRASEKLSGRAILTGNVPHEELLAVVKSADIFVLNSSYEGLSHLLIEAQALGVPTIATDAGGNPEVITNEVNGLLIPVGDTSALSRALARMLGDDELRARLRAAASESAHRFSTEAMLTATATLMMGLRNPSSKI